MDQHSTVLPLLHLCDSLFPIGAFAYSDGLEGAAMVRHVPENVATGEDLRGWLEVCLHETIGRLEGPAVWRAWAAVESSDSDTLIAIDRELIALRPSSSARRSTRAMGQRLLSTWVELHPHQSLGQVAALAEAGTVGPTLPIAFAAACAASGVERRHAVEAYTYTRLSATVSAAMRLMPIGQTEAHRLLARVLDRVPAVVNAIAASNAPLECFTPLMDVAAMSQQYLHSRLFRS